MTGSGRSRCPKLAWDRVVGIAACALLLSTLSVENAAVSPYKETTFSREDRQRYTVMSNPDKKLAGYSVRVEDCYIWSAIYYLDSPTDYREYLPHRLNPCNLPNNDLVLLDSSRKISGRLFLRNSAFLLMFLIICCLCWYGLR